MFWWTLRSRDVQYSAGPIRHIFDGQATAAWRFMEVQVPAWTNYHTHCSYMHSHSRVHISCMLYAILKLFGIQEPWVKMLQGALCRRKLQTKTINIRTKICWLCTHINGCLVLMHSYRLGHCAQMRWVLCINRSWSSSWSKADLGTAIRTSLGRTVCFWCNVPC